MQKRIIIRPSAHNKRQVVQKEEIFYEKHPEKTKPVPSIHEYVVALEYCGWLPQSTKAEYDIKKDVQSGHPYCCFNHQVGMPTIKYEDDDGNVIGESEPIEFYEYEKQMVEDYEATNYYGVNKCRGAGESEIITVRHMAYKYSINTIKDRKMLLIAGTNQDASNTLMHRIKEILDKIPFNYKIVPRSDFPTQIFLRGGGMMLSLAANLNVLRSYENVGDVIYEESAFWTRIDDTPVLLAGEPHVAKSSAHIGSLSTPNGQRGFMWTKIFNPEIISKYKRQVLNWREVVGLPEKNIENIASYNQINQEIITKFDVFNRNKISEIYTAKYLDNAEYKEWFDEFFEGKTMERILSIKTPVLNPIEVMKTYFTDRAEYDQEYDNQFLLSESMAFGPFSEASFEPEEFEKIDFE